MTKSGSGFTEDQVAEFQEAFALFDTRGDGMIPVTVVGNLESTLNLDCHSVFIGPYLSDSNLLIL